MFNCVRSQVQTRSSIPTRVLEETLLHRVETYGLPLPVQVNEIIVAATESKLQWLTRGVSYAQSHSSASIIFRLIVIVVVYLYFTINSYFKHA